MINWIKQNKILTIFIIIIIFLTAGFILLVPIVLYFLPLPTKNVEYESMYVFKTYKKNDKIIKKISKIFDEEIKYINKNSENNKKLNSELALELIHKIMDKKIDIRTNYPIQYFYYYIFIVFILHSHEIISREHTILITDRIHKHVMNIKRGYEQTWLVHYFLDEMRLRETFYFNKKMINYFIKLDQEKIIKLFNIDA